MVDRVGLERAPMVLGKLAFILFAVVATAALLSGGLIKVLWPWFSTYALARPNARSLHRTPTPQGGGIAVVAATLAVAWAAAILVPSLVGEEWRNFAALSGAVLLLAAVGSVDDVRELPPLSRLTVQFCAVGLVIASMPFDTRIVAWLPWWIERAALVLAGCRFVNLVNFMDGIDWMTVAEVLPITGAVVLLGVLGFIASLPMLVALALFGAMLGFAPFNKPVARLFLGDVGSLPIGLLLGWLLLQLAAAGYLAAAIILPLYYLADSTLTLLRRLAQGERVWQAHRTHFYQRATDGGFSVGGVIARVFLLNLVLVGFALISVAEARPLAGLILLALGSAFVTWLLASFARGRNERPLTARSRPRDQAMSRT